ncbi:MAG: hypothetical protein ACRDGM_13020, partial [bacterium]
LHAGDAQARSNGKEFGPDAYVFGNEVGERITSVREAWEDARARAGLLNNWCGRGDSLRTGPYVPRGGFASKY